MKNNLVKYLTKVTLFGLVVNGMTTPLIPIFAEEVASEQTESHQETTTEATTNSETTQDQDLSKNQSHAFLFEGLETKESLQPYQPQEHQLVLRSVGDVLIHDRVSWMADTYSDLYQNTKVAMLKEGFTEADFDSEADFDFMRMLNYNRPD